jgi:hypothetical protein
LKIWLSAYDRLVASTYENSDWFAVVVFHDENKTAISAFQDSHKPMHYNGTEINTNIQYQYLDVHGKRMDVTQ